MINSFDLEQAIIGAILLQPKLIERLLLDERYFTSPKIVKILNLLKRQYHDFKTIEITGLVANYPDFFQGADKLTVESLVECINIGEVNKFDYYQECLFKLYTNRLILHVIDKFKDNQISQEELLEMIHEIEKKSLKNTSNKLTGEQIYTLISQQKNRINFPFLKLTSAANVQENDLVVIAARPGIGKTGFALNLLENLSNKYKCLYFNMEMTEQQLYRRMVAINSKIPMIFHEHPETEYQNTLLKESCKQISNKKFEIVTGGQTIRTIKSKIIKESIAEHLIVFIDYIGLVRDTEKNRSSYERVTDIVKELRQISLDYNCTIFILAQINRNSEKEKDKWPKISDLKESGELEQSATTVLMLHNENVYKNIEYRTEEIKVIIGKNRNGETGVIDFSYNQKNQKFEEKKDY